LPALETCHCNWWLAHHRAGAAFCQFLSTHSRREWTGDIALRTWLLGARGGTRADTVTFPAHSLRCPPPTRAGPAFPSAPQAVSLAALGAVAAVVLLGGGNGGRRELMSGDANDLWATTPGAPAVMGVSAVAGALNVFRNIAAGSPVATTCWEPPCAPVTVPVRAAALPHRLSGILKGVKLLENRLKDFGSGEDGWQQTMQARILKSPL